MIKFLRNCVLLILLIKSILTNAQDDQNDIIPPSPNASALMEYVNIPINLYAGVPNINLPLLELSGRKLTVPIHLSYHAAGIKVNEIASPAGLGWTLNADGVITRVVRGGKPDESENGYIGVNESGKLIDGVWDEEYVRKISYQELDSEPDIFYFNFMGKAGRFVFDPDGNPVLLPNQEFEIYPAIGPKSVNDYWVIIDNEGVKYIFGKTTESKEETKVNIFKTEVPHNEKLYWEKDPYVSSWYLTEIISPNNEKVTFNYINGNSVNYDIFSETVVDDHDGYCLILPFAKYSVTRSNNSTNNPVHLSEIKSDLGYVKFTYENQRRFNKWQKH